MEPAPGLAVLGGVPDHHDRLQHVQAHQLRPDARTHQWDGYW